MESFHIAFLSSEKRGWALPSVFWAKTDDMFPLVPFWAGESPAAEADEIMVEV